MSAGERPLGERDATPQPDVSSDRDAEPEAETQSEPLEIREIEKLEDDAKGG
jgi:hypothetical protein